MNKIKTKLKKAYDERLKIGSFLERNNLKPVGVYKTIVD